MKKFKEFLGKEKTAIELFNSIITSYNSKNITVALDCAGMDVMLFGNSAYVDFLDQLEIYDQEDYFEMVTDELIINYISPSAGDATSSLRSFKDSLTKCKVITVSDMWKINSAESLHKLIGKKSYPVRIKVS